MNTPKVNYKWNGYIINNDFLEFAISRKIYNTTLESGLQDLEDRFAKLMTVLYSNGQISLHNIKDIQGMLLLEVDDDN